MDEHLAIRGRLEQATPADQRPLQRQRIGQIAVMRHRKATELEIRIKRLHIAQDRVARGGVPVMAHCIAPGQRGDHPRIAKNIRHQPQSTLLMETLAVEADDAGRLLPAMLQRMER